MEKKPIITVQNLGVTYFPGRSNEVRALKDINLEIYPGEYIIFFGPSGCGKSTLLYSLAGLERHISGDIVVNDQNLGKLSQHNLESYYQKTIGMIFQSYHLIPSLSVVENVALPQVAVSGNKDERLKKAQNLLDRFGVGAQSHKLPAELSGGQQQRVAICRSLINNSSILVADEPVGNLDSVSSEEVMKLLRSLNDDLGKTVILVTHDPSHLHHAHRIFYLRDGVITGTKVNTEAERKQSSVTNMVSSLHTSLRHWARTFLPETTKEGNSALVIRAEQLIADVFASISLEEMGVLAERVVPLFTTERHNVQSIVHLLHKSPKEGGLGMNLEKAERLGREIQQLTSEMWTLQKLREEHKDPASERKAIRRMILDEEDITLKNDEAVHLLDSVIARLLRKHMTLHEAAALLTTPLDKGGASMDARTARKIIRRLEFVTDIASAPSGTQEQSQSSTEERIESTDTLPPAL